MEGGTTTDPLHSGVWLRKGKNKIVIFEQLNEIPQQNVNTVREPVLMNLK